MGIRVCSGTYRSRIIETPAGGVRPTTDRVKEAMFSTLGPDLADMPVLDLFAGSGNLGIEALSRGAGHATFVESSPVSLRVIRKNLDSLGLTQKARVIRADVRVFVRSCKEPFGLIFMDPPYNKGLASECAPHVYTLLAPGGVLVVEHAPAERLGMLPWKERRYGGTMVSYLRREDL